MKPLIVATVLALMASFGCLMVPISSLDLGPEAPAQIRLQVDVEEVVDQDRVSLRMGLRYRGQAVRFEQGEYLTVNGVRARREGFLTESQEVEVPASDVYEIVFSDERGRVSRHRVNHPDPATLTDLVIGIVDGVPDSISCQIDLGGYDRLSMTVFMEDDTPTGEATIRSRFTHAAVEHSGNFEFRLLDRESTAAWGPGQLPRVTARCTLRSRREADDEHWASVSIAWTYLMTPEIAASSNSAATDQATEEAEIRIRSGG